ncbi:MAG: patatin-like phospholipase family protein [Acidobacteriota bacterium]|nr:patatin-like phospholipase family protein [Acidobacteriota bacterium]
MSEAVPNRNCDVVMKGGITSGVVYPLAINELAQEFRFRNVGGTSAGAIAAAVTAAAEYSRVTGSGPGFKRLEELPKFLAGSTHGEKNLLNLFPPTKPTRQLFLLATSFLGDAALGEKLSSAIAALFAITPLLTIASFLPPLLLPFALRHHFAAFDALTWIALLVIEFVLLFAGLVVTVGGNVYRALNTTLPKNRFGFSTGRAPNDRNLPGVSEWLHEEIQAIAGRTKKEAPLTFGDLWLAGTPVTNRKEQLERCEKDVSLRSINLQMITTALTFGRPYRLPFEERRFAFRASELREYFSDDVVDHLVKHARPDERIAALNDSDLHALPEPWDLPVIVAARMSLSFPILFSLVPLYAADFSLHVNEHEAKQLQLERCWFIDGGLSSNFPINLFDSMFPRWPTFGITLDGFHSQHKQDPLHERNNVHMIDKASGGLAGRWLRFGDTGIGAFGRYVGAMLDTIRNWRDNTQITAPGFRDRIVHVKLSNEEGGLNLDMDREKVEKLSERGMWAGRLLRERFGVAGATAAPLNWNSHRWTRLRTSMELLQNALRQMANAFDYEDAPYPTYEQLLARNKDEHPKTGYWWPRNAKAFFDATHDLLDASEELANASDFSEDAPHPTPELRISPRL